ncbi:MAG: cobyric acid synthase [Lachnospiraceae bacterium]|nr:cobyric acid synthase [Lachnospiraceae bacterium]
MIFITGGYGSGQAEYAAEHFPGAVITGDYQDRVREQMEAGLDALACAENILREIRSRGEESVIWSCETGCGLVPYDAADRAFREISGRVNCLFAAEADKVIRTVCGIGTVIKDDTAGERTGRAGTGNVPKKGAGSVMIAGTMSNVGKSFIAAGLCRIFREEGYRTAPFKAQNMALNSFITRDGAEIGRAQAVQAAACGIEPDARMNPILLKPTTDSGSQVIVMGHPYADMNAREYYCRKKEFLPYVREAFESLKEEYDVIVLEGAGSPAEINLKEQDIVNMAMAAMADAPVILVGNIDPGGVFAQLYGTVKLLDEEDEERVKGLIINKFRGDISILEPGIKMLEEKTGKPVLGVLPYMDVHLEGEDSLAIEDSWPVYESDSPDMLDIAVIRLPRISNYTDFDALAIESDVRLRYVSARSQLGSPDCVILPGTKSTLTDLVWLRERGLDTEIKRARAGGSFVFGICGGYQMMGREITDEDGAEVKGSARALGMLPLRTVFSRDKITRQVETVSHFGIPGLDGKKIKGYEVHMGREAEMRSADMEPVPQDAAGTYIHGIFDEDGFRGAFIDHLRLRRGEKGSRHDGRRLSYSEFREEEIGRLAKIMREHLDIQAIIKVMGL